MAPARLTIRSLRRHALSQSLFPPLPLADAIDRLGFVQADPIRSPARAQDLILRQRTDSYRAGDLERRYASLDIEEDYLYAYGFVARRVWNLLHPRLDSRPTAFERRVLETVRGLKEAHPAALEAHLGRKRVINAWGGYSKATTRALEDLHYRGLVRIARRENGIRVYKPAEPPVEASSSRQRLRALVLISAGMFAPSPERSLQAVIARYRALGSPRGMVKELLLEGELRHEIVDGVGYVWPSADLQIDEVPSRVRFLAPFDPVIWDRARFEHLWGWPYRFEAYTPAAKRMRGYYAMPLLWRDRFIGWANAAGATGAGGARGARVLDVQIGFVGTRPSGAEFRRELEAEIARLEAFLR